MLTHVTSLCRQVCAGDEGPGTLPVVDVFLLAGIYSTRLLLSRSACTLSRAGSTRTRCREAAAGRGFRTFVPALKHLVKRTPNVRGKGIAILISAALVLELAQTQGCGPHGVVRSFSGQKPGCQTPKKSVGTSEPAAFF